MVNVVEKLGEEGQASWARTFEHLIGDEDKARGLTVVEFFKMGEDFGGGDVILNGEVVSFGGGGGGVGGEIIEKAKFGLRWIGCSHCIGSGRR